MRDALIRIWEQDGYRLEVFDLRRTDRYGKAVVTYRLTHDGEVVFPEGADFHCSPLNSPDDDGTVAAILSFCALKPGDTDPDYFADYTPAQLAWCRRFGDELALLATELEEAHYATRHP